MKNFQKLILPILILVAVILIYAVYFSDKGIGSFNDFDPNNNAVKDIKVKYLSERGVDIQSGSAVFYVSDKNGIVKAVSAPVNLPPGMENAEEVIIRGHLSGDSFHAHEVLLD